jgi:hypothetical protein
VCAADARGKPRAFGPRQLIVFLVYSRNRFDEGARLILPVLVVSLVAAILPATTGEADAGPHDVLQGRRDDRRWIVLGVGPSARRSRRAGCSWLCASGGYERTATASTRAADAVPEDPPRQAGFHLPSGEGGI